MEKTENSDEFGKNVFNLRLYHKLRKLYFTKLTLSVDNLLRILITNRCHFQRSCHTAGIYRATDNGKRFARKLQSSAKL